MKSTNFLVFLCLLLLITLHQIIQKVYQIEVPLVDSYADPLLGISILLFAFKLERRFLCKRKRLTILEIIMVTLLLSIISEFLFPYLSTDFTSDPLDFISFTAGAIFYSKVLND